MLIDLGIIMLCFGFAIYALFVVNEISVPSVSSVV